MGYLNIGLPVWAMVVLQLSIIIVSVAAGIFFNIKILRPGLIGLYLAGLAFLGLAFSIVASLCEWMPFSPEFYSVFSWCIFQFAIAGFILGMFGVKEEPAFGTIAIAVGFIIVALPTVFVTMIRIFP